MENRELGFSFIIKWDSQTRNQKKARIHQKSFMENVPDVMSDKINTYENNSVLWNNWNPWNLSLQPEIGKVKQK